LACNKFNKHPPCSSSLSKSHINAYSGGSKASDYIHKVKVVIIMICKCQHLLTSKASPDLQHAETYNLPSYGEGNCSVSIDQTKTNTTGTIEVIGFKGLGLHHE
jgi:hypothetical protein